ncbi:Bicyclomycin resistance protein [Hydrogenovibrio crunogenus]|uniref:Bcr/CflA family efflux transporter n=1 Tax=Hydrogenovibrio crunogenus TaxID=39765 RepID=A0A4P7P1A7_9GAMM|nr:multidrug effflux MFS transporter [Hydrogenovibrio crunogenus]QBZ83739.1 Bicyclomycin resistance protein [Hydrogenovibrio crunogenus]
MSSAPNSSSFGASTANLSSMFLIMVVALIGMLAPFTIDTYLPSFPAIEAELSANRDLLSQTLAIYLISFAMATLVWGPMADRWGRKPIILTSLIGYLAASFLCALAQNIETLLLGRALQGTLLAGSLVASRAMLRDVFQGDEAQKAMALMMMLFTMAPALAPIIGGWLEVHMGWRSVFYFLAIYSVVIIMLFSVRIKESQSPEHVQSIHPARILKGYWQSLVHPQFLRLVAAQGLIIGGFFVYVAGAASVIFDHLKLGEQDFWVLFVPVVSGVLFGSILIHRITHRFKTTTLINIAFTLATLAVALNLIFETFLPVHVGLVISPLVLYSFAFAMANPGLSLVALDCLPSQRGLASSVQSLFQMGMAGLVAALVVPYVHHSLQWMALSQAILLTLALLLWLGVRRQVHIKT